MIPSGVGAETSDYHHHQNRRGCPPPCPPPCPGPTGPTGPRGCRGPQGPPAEECVLGRLRQPRIFGLTNATAASFPSLYVTAVQDVVTIATQPVIVVVAGTVPNITLQFSVYPCAVLNTLEPAAIVGQGLGEGLPVLVPQSATVLDEKTVEVVFVNPLDPGTIPAGTYVLNFTVTAQQAQCQPIQCQQMVQCTPCRPPSHKKCSCNDCC